AHRSSLVSPASNWPGIAAERFANQCREIIAPFLDEYGFRCVRDHVTPNSASLSLANDDRYVALSLSFDPRDAPHACRVILGEGSLEMPECDWNGIGLWRLVDEPRTNPVEIKGIDDVDSALAEVLMQLQQAAHDFLRGDVRRFRAARVEQKQAPRAIHYLGPRRRREVRITSRPGEHCAQGALQQAMNLCACAA